VVFLLLGALLVHGQSAAPAQTPNKDEKSAANAQATSTKPATTISPEKEAAIRKLFIASAVKESMQKMLAGSLENAKPSLMKMLPPGDYQEKLINLFLERFQQKMKLDEMLDLLVPIYDKYFSKEDIEGITKFYETPAGKKALLRLTDVMLESQAVGMKYGEEAGKQAMTEVLAEHSEIQKALEEASKKPN
jgi:hypothetical protein